MTDCPHPEKHSHKSKAAAIRARDALEASKGIDLALKPYRCACGRWHLGHAARRNRLERLLLPKKPKR